jgi:hypothetical protein
MGMDLRISILGVLRRMYRPRGRPDSIDSARRSLTYRRWPSGHCGRYLCDRLRLSDGHTPPRDAAHDGRRKHPSVGRSARMGAVRGWRSFSLIGSKERSLLEALARPSDELGVALGTIAHRTRDSCCVQSAIRRARREGVHTGSQYMGAPPGTACLQLPRPRRARAKFRAL